MRARCVVVRWEAECPVEGCDWSMFWLGAPPGEHYRKYIASKYDEHYRCCHVAAVVPEARWAS